MAILIADNDAVSLVAAPSTLPTVREVLSNGLYYNVATSFNLVTGVDTEVGDRLLVITGEDWATVDDMPSPTGTSGAWQLLTRATLGTNLPHLKVWTREVTVAGAQTVTIRQNASDPGEYAAVLLVISAGSVVEDIQIASDSDNESSYVAPSATALGDDRLLVCGYFSGWTPDGSIALAPAAGMTERAEVSVVSISTSAALSLMVASQTATSGPTGTKTATVTGTAKPYLAVSVLLRGETTDEPLIRDMITDELAAVVSLEELGQSRAIGAVSATSTFLLATAMTDQRVPSFALAATGAIAASNTDYWSVALTRYRAASATTIATRTTQVSAPNGAVAANTAWTLDLIAFGTAQYLQTGDVLAVTFTATGSPTAWAGAVASWRYEPGVTA